MLPAPPLPSSSSPAHQLFVSLMHALVILVKNPFVVASCMSCVPQLLAPAVASGAMSPAEVVRSCWVFGPSGLAFGTVAAAVASVKPSMADLEAAGIAGVLPTIASVSSLTRQLAKVTEVFGATAACASELLQVAESLASKPSDAAGSAAAAATALAACTSFSTSVGVLQRAGFARAVVSLSCNWALNAGGWDPDATGTCLAACKPLFSSLSSSVGCEECFDAGALWLASQMMSGDADSSFVAPIISAFVDGGLTTVAAAKSWKAAAASRSEAVSKLASLISL